MKRLLFPILIILGLSGCAYYKNAYYSADASYVNARTSYSDGEYTGEAPLCKATIVIKNGIIESVRFQQTGKNGAEQPFTDDEGGNSQIAAYIFANRIITYQGVDVPSVKDYENMCDLWRQAARSALDEAGKVINN